MPILAIGMAAAETSAHLSDYPSRLATVMPFHGSSQLGLAAAETSTAVAVACWGLKNAGHKQRRRGQHAARIFAVPNDALCGFHALAYDGYNGESIWARKRLAKKPSVATCNRNAPSTQKQFFFLVLLRVHALLMCTTRIRALLLSLA
jgi:hypothetical protein